MRLLTKVITASVGFAFTVGGFGKVSAQEAKLSKDGSVVIAKESRTPSMSSVEQLRKNVIILAGQAPTKGTKPTKTRTKSPKKPPTKK